MHLIQFCTFFLCVDGENIDETKKSIDTFKPTNKDEFNELAKMLAEKLSQFEVCEASCYGDLFCRILLHVDHLNLLYFFLSIRTFEVIVISVLNFCNMLSFGNIKGS